MGAVRVSEIRRLRGLKNISWLTSRQVNRLAYALMVSGVGKHGVIFDEKKKHHLSSAKIAAFA